MCSSSNNHRLFLAKIQRKREEMFINGGKYGLSAPQTIASSQELDQLLNEYYKIFQSTSSAKTTIQARKQSFVLIPKPFATTKVKTS